jgi:hypothetical protein
MSVDPMIQYGVLGAFALLFAFSALDKWLDFDSFVTQLEAYQLLPDRYTTLTARTLLGAELVTATLLISPAFFFGVLSGLTLLAGYTLGIWINLQRGRTHIDCGCLGSTGEDLSYYLVARNVVLLAILGCGLTEASLRVFTWLDYTAIVLLIVTASLGYFTVSELIKNHMNAQHWWG